MSINLYQPTPVTTDLVIYQPPAALMSPVCPVCPPPTHGPSIPQGMLETLFLFVGMLLQYALARFRALVQGEEAGGQDQLQQHQGGSNIYEEANYHPGPSAPPPSVCPPPPPPPPSTYGGLVINVGNPFTNPFVNGPHQG